MLFYVKNKAPIVTKVEIPEVTPSESPIIAPTSTKVLEIPEPIKPTTTIQNIEAKLGEETLEPNEIRIKEGEILKLKIINTATTSFIVEIKGVTLNLKLNKGEYFIFSKIENTEKQVGKIVVE
jgi:hypothetical protein